MVNNTCQNLNFESYDLRIFFKVDESRNVAQYGCKLNLRQRGIYVVPAFQALVQQQRFMSLTGRQPGQFTAEDLHALQQLQRPIHLQNSFMQHGLPMSTNKLNLTAQTTVDLFAFYQHEIEMKWHS